MSLITGKCDRCGKPLVVSFYHGCPFCGYQNVVSEEKNVGVTVTMEQASELCRRMIQAPFTSDGNETVGELKLRIVKDWLRSIGIKVEGK